MAAVAGCSFRSILFLDVVAYLEFAVVVWQANPTSNANFYAANFDFTPNVGKQLLEYGCVVILSAIVVGVFTEEQFVRWHVGGIIGKYDNLFLASSYVRHDDFFYVFIEQIPSP